MAAGRVRGGPLRAPSRRSLRAVPGALAALGRRWRPAVSWTARLTAAAVASWVVAVGIFPGSAPLLAPLTALLVVQATPISQLSSGLDRVASVVTGVLVAVGFAAVVDLTWWSLGLAIALSMLVGQALRLGANLVEVPISAMLVMGVGYGAEAAAGQRVAETLVGAAVGIATSLLVPPRPVTDQAGTALRRLADEVADLLDSAADDVEGLGGGAGTAFGEHAERWLERARRLTQDVPAVETVLVRAEEGRRLNLRALATADPAPGLRLGLEALEHSAVAVRSMFRALRDAGGARVWTDDDLGADVRLATALVLHEQAAGMRAFGQLLEAEARAGGAAPETAPLRSALDGLLEAQARLTDLVLVDDPVFTELNVTMLITVRRLLAELDLDERLRRLDRLRVGARRALVRHRAGSRRSGS